METCLAATKKSKQGGKISKSDKNNNLRIGNKLYQNIKLISQLGFKFQIWSKPSTSSQ